ncbi:MAG TPA: DeoR/GlpR family DNA-binding transcription regulator [Kouleothrix sp.]|jgi:DeoR/GlpR family transcriptional regulator of sugar metabolism|nr:DeoR/GlpR family DNA-binding transcription regulator [Kouleothrix sp.]
MSLNTGRQQQIAQIVRQQRSATVQELSAQFGVSEATIRRDLEKLDGQGVIQRAHGGAVALESALPEPPIVRRLRDNQDEKRRIGLAAARLVHDGETIFLGSGTTTIEVARQLGEKRDLKVITNALNVANILANFEHITVIITGGLLRHSEMSMIGHLTEQAMRELRADKAIMSIRALSLGAGLTNEYGMETTIDRAIIGFAPHVIVLADHSKWGKSATAFVAPVSAAHTIVTTDAAPSAMVKQLQTQGIQIVFG